jgi:predicted transcriptional regulator
MPYSIQEITPSEHVEIFKALASEVRLRILELLIQEDMNINELSGALGLTQPGVSKHIQVLEEAGLVSSDYTAGAQGMQKRCRHVFDRLILAFDTVKRDTASVLELAMPVGMYVDHCVSPTCGLASTQAFIGDLDAPNSFFLPQRADAQILWSSSGYVEYAFPISLPDDARVTALDLVVEIGSETPGYNNDYPSDISLWINGLDAGHTTTPGDLGGAPGRLNPSWWHAYLNQFGVLRCWSITNEGAFIEGAQVSDVTIRDLRIASGQVLRVRIGVKENTPHQGGFTLFGRGFGQYEQDLTLRLHYSRAKSD